MKKIITLLFVLSSLFSYSQSTTLVISQVYGGGGNTGAPLSADFVELHNISGVPQSLAGLSVQYSPATGATWTGVFALPSASIPAGGYYLIKMSATGTNGVALPTPDASTPTGMEIAMSSTNGKVALANGVTALTSCTATGVIDLVGFGTTANCSETAATPVLSNTTAALRKNNGCTETNSNLADFTVGAPAPRNSASPVFACGAVSPSLTVTGIINDFGTVLIGSNSVSQTYNLSGANLTGAPGIITISAPSTDFQVSNDNTAWGASTTIPYTSATLAATPVWIRFTPQSAGLKTGNVTNTGGGVSVPVNVAVSGNGQAPVTPVLSASSLAAFGNVCVNATVGNSFTISGVNLTTADITVGPLAGFSFSTTAAGTYTPSLTLTQPGGTYSQNVFVNFTPVANQSYDGNIAVTGGGAPSVNVGASGAGADNPPTVTTGAATLITTTTATLAGNISSTGCTAVTGYGVEYSLINGFVNGTVAAASNLNAGDFSSALASLAPSTTYYYKAYATNGGGTAYGAQQSFTTAAPSITATALTAFGNACLNATTAANSFTLTSAGLSTADVTVGPLAGYSFATTAAGPYTASLILTQPGGPYTQEIFVNFTPTSNQSYNGNIPVSGGGATAINVFASGTGNNNPPTVITGSVTSQPFNVITLSGSLTGTGCSPVTSYGIEYSGVSGFTNSYGTKIPASDLNGTDFSITSNSFVQHVTYYYKAYATNNGGTAYGDEQTFTTDSIAPGLVIYSSPVTRNGEMHYSLYNLKPGHYQVQLINAAGQVVHRRDLIQQVNFINDRFMLPSQIRTGVYYLQISNQDFSIGKSFIVR